MSEGTRSPDGQWLWTGTEWIPSPPSPLSHTESPLPEFNVFQPMHESPYSQILYTDQNKKSQMKPAIKVAFAILAVCMIGFVSILILIQIDDEKYDEYSLEYSHATAYIYISSIEVDNGENNRMFEVDVFYDERNRYEYRTGYECDALEYYDIPRTYYLEEFCVINFADPFVDEVTFGACAEYVASDQSYDISPNNVYGSGCIKWTSSPLNPSIDPSFGLEDDCTYDGEIIEDELELAKYVSVSGFDDGDSNAYNGELIFTLSFQLSYLCNK